MNVKPASVPGTLKTTVCADSVTSTLLDDVEPASTQLQYLVCPLLKEEMSLIGQSISVFFLNTNSNCCID